MSGDRLLLRIASRLIQVPKLFVRLVVVDLLIVLLDGIAKGAVFRVLKTSGFLRMDRRIHLGSRDPLKRRDCDRRRRNYVS